MKQLFTFMLVNKQFRRGAQEYIRRTGMGGQYTDWLMSRLMKQYYTAPKNPSLFQRLSIRMNPPYKETLQQAKKFLAEQEHVHLGLACPDVMAPEYQPSNPDELHAPAYWPFDTIQPRHILGLLQQLDGKTDLKSLQVGAGHHGLPVTEEEAFVQSYGVPPRNYQDNFPIMDASQCIENIVQKLAAIQRANPELESVSLSIGIGHNPGFVQHFRNRPAQRTLEQNFFKALRKHPGITSLNVVAGNENIVSEIAAIAADAPKISSVTFHVFSRNVTPKISDSLCKAMAKTQTPLSFSCHMHPAFSIEPLPSAPASDGTPIKNMIISFATSEYAKSLRFEVHQHDVQVVLTAMGKGNDYLGIADSYPLPQGPRMGDDIDANVAAQIEAHKNRLEAVMGCLKEGIAEQLIERGNVTFKVRQIDIRCEEEKQHLRPGETFWDFEIFLQNDDVKRTDPLLLT